MDDGFDLFDFLLEAEEGGRVADVTKEEDGCDGGDQEGNCDDFVEVFRKPGGEIE